MPIVSPVGPEVTVSTPKPLSQNHPDATVFSDGKVAVAWVADPDAHNHLIFRVVNPDGSFATAEQEVGVEGFSPALATDASGQVALLEFTSNPATSETDIEFTALTETGVVRTPLTTLATNANALGDHFATGDVVALGASTLASFTRATSPQNLGTVDTLGGVGGGDVTGHLGGSGVWSEHLAASPSDNLVWTAGEQGSTSVTVAVQAFHGDGSAAGGLINLGTGANAVIAALPGGRAVVAWELNGDILYKIVGVSGAEAGSALVANTHAGSEVSPSITALADGRFVIVWSDHSPVGHADFDVVARVFNSDGSAVAPEFALGVSQAGFQSDVSVTARPDGGFTAVWADGSSTQIKLQSFSVVSDDQLQAGSGNTFINGAAGDDTITGWSGGDVLRGGDGDDSIQGGSGFDDINGNKGADTIDGGVGGHDWLVGGQGNDLIVAHQSDVVWGNLGDDTLHGGSTADQVRGGQGYDSLAGGSGDEFISGDRGNDTETGGGGADLFHSFSGAGIDRVLDFNQAEGDRVMLDPGTAFTVSQVGADTVVDMNNGDKVILVGITLSTLRDGWIFLG